MLPGRDESRPRQGPPRLRGTLSEWGDSADLYYDRRASAIVAGQPGWACPWTRCATRIHCRTDSDPGSASGGRPDETAEDRSESVAPYSGRIASSIKRFQVRPMNTPQTVASNQKNSEPRVSQRLTVMHTA